MSNKKVYLAKNTLARGLDVECVKSHLERIPGIIIIESGMGINPEDCASFVIVSNPEEKHKKGGEVILSKNVYQDLESFIENYEGDEDCPEDCVYIYSGSKASAEHDVEELTPFSYYCTENSYTEILDVSNYDAFGFVYIEVADEEDEESERDETNLLHCITSEIGADARSWMNIPRHHQPAPQFAVPPVPTIEQRILKQSPLPKEDLALQLETVTRVWSFDRRRLLLLRRR